MTQQTSRTLDQRNMALVCRWKQLLLCQVPRWVTMASKGFMSSPGFRVAFLGNDYRASDFLALDIETGSKAKLCPVL